MKHKPSKTYSQYGTPFVQSYAHSSAHASNFKVTAESDMTDPDYYSSQ